MAESLRNLVNGLKWYIWEFLKYVMFIAVMITITFLLDSNRELIKGFSEYLIGFLPITFRDVVLNSKDVLDWIIFLYFPWNYRVGPFCFSFTPLSLYPGDLPWYLPSHNRLSVGFLDEFVTYNSLICHVVPSISISIPPMSYYFSTPLKLHVIFVSFSVEGFPNPLVGCGLNCPLTELLRLRFGEIRGDIVLFPTHTKRQLYYSDLPPISRERDQTKSGLTDLTNENSVNVIDVEGCSNTTPSSENPLSQVVSSGKKAWGFISYSWDYCSSYWDSMRVVRVERTVRPVSVPGLMAVAAVQVINNAPNRRS